MDRWWSCPESSLAALDRVDSSDTKQGVGTAVLAYHGLSKAILEPLGLRTLQDVSMVNKALHGLDISPVAVALGHATEPEMGAASTRYGQLLADDLHRVAIESTGRMITGLVQSGMPWPTAIDRASRVHGIPADRLGRAGVALRAPVMAPLAADDIADRALMEYASHVGRREATAQDVSKAERERFREEEVVRDYQGRFADEAPKNKLVALSRDGLDDALERQRKREKKDKRVRVMARKKKLAALREARKPKEVTLADIARAQQQRKDQARAETTMEPAKERIMDGTDNAAERRAEAKAERLSAEKDALKDVWDAMEAKVLEAAKNRLLEALRNRKPPKPDEEFGDLLDNPVKPRGDGMHSGHVSGSKGQQQFMLLDVRLAEAAVKQGGFNYGTISSSPHFYGGFDSRSGDEAMDRETLRDVIISRSFEPDAGEGRTFLDGLAIVVFDGDVAHPAGFTGIYDEPLANAGTYMVPAPGDGSKRALSYDDAYGLDLRAYENPGSRTSPKVDITLPHFVVHLDNGKAFTDDAEEVEKVWDESSVERDEDGKFADETRAVRTPEEKAAKRAKLLKRRRRMADIQARAAASKPREVTLADISRAQQARRSAERADAAHSLASGSAVSRSVSGAAERELRLDAARTARLAVLRDIRNKTLKDAEARVLVKARERLATRLAALDEVRTEHHNEWKNLDALTFDRDTAHGSFVDMFGFDPYNGRVIQAGRAVHGDVEHEDMLSYQMMRVKSVPAVAEGMHERPPSDSFGDEEPAWDSDGPASLYQHYFDAWAAADAACTVRNEENPSKRKTWQPFTRKDAGTDMFEPWMVEVSMEQEHIVVLGSKADWRLVKSGSDVRLVPLAGFDKDPDNPGQGMFDTLFNAVSDASEHGSYSGTSGRSDYFIRAFRIKT